MSDKYTVDNWSFKSNTERNINDQDNLLLKCYSKDKDETYTFNATLIKIETGNTTGT